MKKLILVRHGDAPRGSTSMDIDRELSVKGQKQVALSAQYLEKYEIGHVLCSPVIRTRQTLAILNNNLNFDENIVDYPPSIYENSHDTLRRLVDIQQNEQETMLIIGHNPSLIQLALYYDAEPEENWHDILSLGLKPAEVIVIEFKKAENWGQTYHAGGRILDIFIPRHC